MQGLSQMFVNLWFILISSVCGVICFTYSAENFIDGKPLSTSTLLSALAAVCVCGINILNILLAGGILAVAPAIVLIVGLLIWGVFVIIFFNRDISKARPISALISIYLAIVFALIVPMWLASVPEKQVPVEAGKYVLVYDTILGPKNQSIIEYLDPDVSQEADYYFRFYERDGKPSKEQKAVGSQIQLLEEQSSVSAYVKGEFWAFARIDPVFKQPIICSSRATYEFRVETVYAHPEDIYLAGIKPRTVFEPSPVEPQITALEIDTPTYST